jgi:hypothetical protein
MPTKNELTSIAHPRNTMRAVHEHKAYLYSKYGPNVTVLIVTFATQGAETHGRTIINLN